VEFQSIIGISIFWHKSYNLVDVWDRIQSGESLWCGSCECWSWEFEEPSSSSWYQS